MASDETGFTGLALVSFFDYGLYPFGMIHELSVRPSSNEFEVRRQLATAATDWLRQHGAVIVTATASEAAERAAYEKLGFNASMGEMVKRITGVQAARYIAN